MHNNYISDLDSIKTLVPINKRLNMFMDNAYLLECAFSDGCLYDVVTNSRWEPIGVCSVCYEPIKWLESIIYSNFEGHHSFVDIVFAVWKYDSHLSVYFEILSVEIFNTWITEKTEKLKIDIIWNTRNKEFKVNKS